MDRLEERFDELCTLIAEAGVREVDEGKPEGTYSAGLYDQLGVLGHQIYSEWMPSYDPLR